MRLDRIFAFDSGTLGIPYCGGASCIVNTLRWPPLYSDVGDELRGFAHTDGGYATASMTKVETASALGGQPLENTIDPTMAGRAAGTRLSRFNDSREAIHAWNLCAMTKQIALTLRGRESACRSQRCKVLSHI